MTVPTVDIEEKIRMAAETAEAQAGPGTGTSTASPTRPTARATRSGETQADTTNIARTGSSPSRAQQRGALDERYQPARVRL